MAEVGQITAVVPTLGRSPLLRQCLEALRRDGGSELQIVLVDQGEGSAELPSDLWTHRLSAPGPVGFAAAANRGIAAACKRWVALVNDDVVVRPPWLASLTECLAGEPDLGAVQGVNLTTDGERLDGCGLAFNSRWQAVQIGHGRPVRQAPGVTRNIFGVSATAAVYRRKAMLAAAEIGVERGAVFDPRLGSYYEDVDLAGRLRSRGYRARLVPHVRCRHLGSASSTPTERLRLVYRNRYLVLARLLGYAFWPRLPLLVLRDLADFVRALLAGETRQAGAIASGVAGVPRMLGSFARQGPPLLAVDEIRRLGTCV